MIRMYCEGQGSRTAAEEGKDGRYYSSLYLSCGGALEQPRARDLARVGQATFLADRAFRRGMAIGQWTRSLKVVVPVEEPERWNALAIKVASLANFVSGDCWHYEFVEKKTKKSRSQELRREIQASSVNLFSSGLDSLCGAAAAFRRREAPFFVSHSPPGFAAVQKRISKLEEKLQVRASASAFANFLFRASDKDKHGLRNLFPERSRRTRPVLFLSMAGAIALEFAIPRLNISENGVLAVNLPFQPYLHGPLISRHAHPGTLRRFQSLLQALWPYDSIPVVANPFAALTKGEQIRYLRGAEDLAEQTVSCQFAGQQTATLIHWLKKRGHRWQGIRECGLCLPCLVRRAAMWHAGIKESRSHYAFSVRATLKRPRVYKDYPLFNAVRFGIADLLDFCRRVQRMRPEEFTRSFTIEIAHVCGTECKPAQVAQEIYVMYRRFAAEMIHFVDGNR